MYVKTNFLKDHVQEVHTTKSLGKSLLHSTNKAQNALNAKNHSQRSRALKHREDYIKKKTNTWSKKNQPTSTTKEGQRSNASKEKTSVGKSKL